MSKGHRRGRVAVLGAALVVAAVALTLPASGLGTQAKSDQACQLSVFSWWTGGGEAAGLDRLIKIWNKQNPSCPFKNETVAGGAGSNAKAVLAQRLAAGNPPDSFQGHAGAELRDYIKAGQVEPVDFIYKQAGFGKVMPASLINQIRYNGKLYSVPVNIHRANVLWYNPKTLKANGIAVPKSWAQFIAALEKAEAAGLIPLAMGEQWTAQHLLETVMIGALGPKGWAALWKPNSAKQWATLEGDDGSEPLQHAARLHELRRRVADVAGRREARCGRQGRVQRDGRLAGRVLQRDEEGRQPRPEAGNRLRLGSGARDRQRLRLALRQLHAAEGRSASRGSREVADVPR